MPHRAGRVAHAGRWSKVATASAPEAVSLDFATEEFELPEELPWPPRARVGEAPSPLVKLAAIMEASTKNDDLWDFVAGQIVERLHGKTRTRPRSKAPQTETAALQPKEPKPAQDRSRTVHKLRLAKALECPVPPGPVECPMHSSTVQLGQHLHHTECCAAPSMDPGNIQDMLLNVGGAKGPKVQQVRLQGVPEDWGFGSLSAVFQGIGLCMQCDVGLVQMESRGCFVIDLKSEVAASKCLQLDAHLVQHGGVPWPLCAKRVKPRAPQAVPPGLLATKAPPPRAPPAGALRSEDLEQRLLDIATAAVQPVEPHEPLEEPAPRTLQAEKPANAAEDCAGSVASIESIDRLAKMFLLDALSEPTGGLTPGGKERQLWSDLSDDLPDEGDVLQALMK